MAAIGLGLSLFCYFVLMTHKRDSVVSGEETGVYCQVHCKRCARLMIKDDQGFISCANKLCERQGILYYPPSIKIYRVGEKNN